MKNSHFSPFLGAILAMLVIAVSLFGASARTVSAPANEELSSEESGLAVIQDNSLSQINSPETPRSGYRIIDELYVKTTGYSSTPDQTNEDPFTTASGQRVRWGIVAVSRDLFRSSLPFGTLIRMPVLFGDEIFVVRDLMNIRKTNQIDVWFPSRWNAQRFGVHNIRIEIVAPF